MLGFVLFVKTTGLVKLPLQIVWFTGWFTVGVGCTDIINEGAVKEQPWAITDKVMFAWIVPFVELIAVNLGILKNPAFESPIEILSLLQEKFPPGYNEAKAIDGDIAPLQREKSWGWVNTGIGLIKMDLVYVSEQPWLFITIKLTKCVPGVLKIKLAWFELEENPSSVCHCK